MSVWDESRERQTAAKGRVRFAPGELADVLETLSEAVIRPSAGAAFSADPIASIDQLQAMSRGAEVLVERIRQDLDPRGVLSG